MMWALFSLLLLKSVLMQTPSMQELHLATATWGFPILHSQCEGSCDRFQTYQSERKEEEGNNVIFRRGKKKREREINFSLLLHQAPQPHWLQLSLMQCLGRAATSRLEPASRGPALIESGRRDPCAWGCSAFPYHMYVGSWWAWCKYRRKIAKLPCFTSRRYNSLMY